MSHALSLHPDSRCAGAARIEVDVARPRGGHLALRYVVTGAMSEFHLPPAAAPARADGLWRRTCFEAFVGAAPGAAYLEFNFAPSTQWAAYGFSGYRTGMRQASGIAAPHIEVERGDARFELRVSLELDRASLLPGDAPWRLGLAAVVEEADGRISYWALAHPPGRADFHHADGFALALPMAEAR
jgi:hypothetical protein